MAKPLDIRLSPVAQLQPGEDLAQLRQYAERYEWLRQRAVRVQGSEVWYWGLGSNGTENQRKHELEFALLVCDC